MFGRAPRRAARPRASDERGAVVAEFAVALPAVILVLLLSAAALNACALQVRLQDAAADAARLAARGEPDGRVAAAVAAVGGSALTEQRGDLVCVTATALLPPLGGLRVSSCALAGGR